ncbi:MAG: hypothetical protein IIT65_05945 [Lachnospiraceae bacterium]|nr:hypothetical protein [Eubacterium sp.]MBQ5474234.1 hypothetical protein [Lachnospiraceae bacterium]
MDREKYIVVPKNKTAMEHFDHGIENEAELEIVTLSYPEFMELYKIGLFDLINRKCDIIIDEYEEEILELDKIPIAVGIIEELLKHYNNKRLNDIKEAFEHAFFYNTMVEFDF